MTTTALRVPIGCFALLLGVLFTTTAEAAPKRVGVPKFDGVQEALVRKKVMQILKAHGYDLAKSREMEIALANTGALLDNDEGFQKVAKELALAAIVTGEIGKKRAKISVHDGKDGSLLGEANFAGANPHKIMAEVGRDFWKKLGGEVERGKTPSGSKKPQKVVAEAPEDDERTPDAAGGEGAAEPAPEPRKSKAEPAAAAEGGGEGEEPPPKKKKKKKKTRMEGEGDVVREEGPEIIPPIFDAYLGLGVVNRGLAYNQDASSPGLRPYSLGGGPALVGSIVWYPLYPLTDGAAKEFGVEGHVEQAFAVSSSLPPDANGVVQKFGTSIHEFSGGVRYRMPFGDGHFLYGSLTGGEHAFTFKSTDTGNRRNLDIPDTIYRFIRPGVGVHFQLPMQLAFQASAGYRYIFNGGGQFKDVFFPYSNLAGVDAEAYLAWSFMPNFEVRAVFSFRRYFSSMNCYDAAAANGGNRCIRTITNPDGTMTMVNFTTGGAVDQYLAGGVVVAVTLGGTEAARPEAEEPPPPPKRKRKVSEDEEPGAGGGEDSGGGGDE